MLTPKSYDLLTAQSMGASFASAAIPLNFYYGCSIQAVWTGGSAAGSLFLTVSNDDVTYSTYTGSATTVAGAGDFMWDVVQSNVKYVKLNFTRSGGTGSCSAKVQGKTV